jgi:carboxypeptidase C (cathepsin A)
MENESRENNRSEEQAQAIPRDNLVETSHTISLDGVEIPYKVTCGTMVLKEEIEKMGEEGGKSEGEVPKAKIFFIAYLRDDIGDKRTRPITFSFNGGPGSSSVWLHLGVLGPRRVVMGEAGNLLPPPYGLEDNAHSLLDMTDLVFIDPVSTGYSRPVPGEKASEFHGFKKDIESVGDFIRLYLSRYQRWSSPKFLIGESYGTTRAAGLSGYLQERHGMYLNGIMLVSTILNFQTHRFDLGNDLPYVFFLPTYTATAWYHQRLPDDLQMRSLREVLDEVESFAIRNYNPALLKGATLSTNERAKIRSRLARYTGLKQDFIERCDLRVSIHRFIKELLRDRGLTVGRLDSRFTGFDRDDAGETVEHDPSNSAITGPYTTMFNQYVRAELQFESDLPYEILNPNLWQKWRYDEYANRYVNVAETLRKAISINPHLKVFVANGYYDLATPHFATEYTFNHLGLEPSLQPNISMAYYEAGHMMYVHPPSLEKMKADLVGFIKSAVGG